MVRPRAKVTIDSLCEVIDPSAAEFAEKTSLAENPPDKKCG